MKKYNLHEISRREYGGFWIRALATLIDLVVLWIPMGIIEVLVEAHRSRALQGAVVYGVWAVYCILFWLTPWRGTPGKRLCGLTILSSDGTEISAGKAAWRYIALIISGTVIVGPLLVALTERREGLHDLLAGTVVVKRSALAKGAI